MTDTAIIGLALRNQSNLEAALRIGENFREIRLAVVRSFLVSFRDRLREWSIAAGEGWQVVEERPAGNWVEQPENKWLHILLRKEGWPSLVGVGMTSDVNGPRELYLGVMAPSRKDWNENPSANLRWYGKVPDIFIGPETRGAISNKLGGSWKTGPWWVAYSYLRDDDGHDISNWLDRETVARLFSEKDSLCNALVKKFIYIATSIAKIKMTSN